MAHRSLDEMGVRQVLDPNGHERENLVDNLWYELRDDVTITYRVREFEFFFKFRSRD